MYENKKIYVLGLARSGYEVSKLLAGKNEILVTDMKLKNMEHVSELESLGVKLIETNEQDKYLDESFDLVVKNPGIKLDNATVLKAESLGIPVINEVEVAYEFLKDNFIIAISGSNGKTTTTTLIYEILSKAFDDVLLGGNIGYPVCSLVNHATGKSKLVLEISSHQLTNMNTFKADIAILTNLMEVHLDHFGSFDNYKSYKVRIFNNQTENDTAILNAGDINVMNDTKDILSEKITFSSVVDADLYLKGEAIYYKEEKIVDTKDIVLKGNHNYENIMAAILAVKEVSPETEIILQSIIPVNSSYEKYAPFNSKEVAKKFAKANKELKKLAKKHKIAWVDITTALSDENGDLKAEYTNDGYHLMGKAYVEWANTLKPHLAD